LAGAQLLADVLLYIITHNWSTGGIADRIEKEPGILCTNLHDMHHGENTGLFNFSIPFYRKKQG